MSLFGMVKGKAAELLTGASDKVSELTGIDLPGDEIAEQLTRSADGSVPIRTWSAPSPAPGRISPTPRALQVTPPQARSARSPTRSIPARNAEHTVPPYRGRPPVDQRGRTRDALAREVTRLREQSSA
jgi:hypothetical protein